MKKVFFLVMLSATTSSHSIQGVESINKSTYNYGYQKYGKESLDSIQANGSVILEGTKVTGLVKVNGSLNAEESAIKSLQVNGSLYAEESAIKSLQVNGQADLQNCVFTSTATINGSLNADNTKFESELLVASQKIVLRRALLHNRPHRLKDDLSTQMSNTSIC